MRTYIVPFEAKETSWNSCIAKVEASSKEEAFKMVEKSIEESNPFRDFNAEWNGINTVTNEVIETSKYAIGDEYSCAVDDVEEADERVYCTLDLTAFDIARYGKDALYHQAENIFLEVGLELEIFEMDMIPIKFEEHFVAYKCIPTDFTRTFTDGDVWHMKDGKKL